jgi:hypothetical protein
MINNPSCIEPVNSFSPTLSLFFPFPKQFRMSGHLPSFAVSSSELLSLGSLGKIPTGTREF